ncbi:hypothetical protein JTB14_026319 [Gonioctena quinquepunctata]|nr:hypothetical protein JTB14_026319 [Gonioctena quinquepunctata]
MESCSEKSEHFNKPNLSGINLMLNRASIVLGMAAAVYTMLYFTPLPDQTFKSCDRPCHDLDWPMICRVKMNIEMFQSNLVCEDCPKNATDCSQSFCPSSDDTPRGIITVNRQLPGPPIHVCHNDILIIDVINKIPGHSFTIHWRGQPNHETPFMDGVPMVTQCPIPSYSTFQYKFRASSPGTHFYHAHSDSDRSNGLFGAIVVRQSDKMEPHRKEYDVDLEDHVIVLSEWSTDSTRSWDQNNGPRHILVNGKGPHGASLAVFSVSKRKRYRFRVAYVGGSTGCPMSLSIDRHFLKVISLDGNPTRAYDASSIKISKGERVDFILKTNRESGAYFLRVVSDCNGEEVIGQAVISYEGVSSGAELANLESLKNSRRFDTALGGRGVGDVSLGEVEALDKLDPVLKEDNVDRKLYLAFDYADEDIDLTRTGLTGLRTRTYRMNNITFTYPPSPLLTQSSDVPVDLMCNESKQPARCSGGGICECVHIEHLPLGSSTEIILIDQGGDQVEHIFHLHGHHFHIMGSRIFEQRPSRNGVIELDKAGYLIKRNFANPVRKDTVRVPRNGVVVLRFLADNPGFWLLRDEQSRGWTRGMDILFQVGDLVDVVSTPSDFPVCVNFIGPDFFLV